MLRRISSRRSLLSLAAAALSGTAFQVGGCGSTVDALTNNVLGTGTWDHFNTSFGYDRRRSGGGSLDVDFDTDDSGIGDEP